MSKLEIGILISPGFASSNDCLEWNMKFHSSCQPLGGCRAVGDSWDFRAQFLPTPTPSPSRPPRRSSSSCAARAARQKPSALSCCLVCTRCVQDAWRRRARNALFARRPGPKTLMRRPWITSSSRVCSSACRCTGRSLTQGRLAPAAKSRPTSGASNASSSSAQSASRPTSGSSSMKSGPCQSSAVSLCASSWTASASPTTSSAPTPTTASLP